MKVLFVPGIFAKPIKYLFGTYFADQIKYLDDRGIAWEYLQGYTDKSTLVGSELIANAIQIAAREGQKVFLFTHSKGGVDALDALIRYPELRDQVEGFVALQSPFFGSPVADYLSQKQPFLTKLLLTLARSEMAAIEDVTTATRTEYMFRHRTQIRNVTKAVRTVCISSEKRSGFDTVLKLTLHAMEKRGHIGDGLVPRRHARIPGSQSFHLENLDHASAVVRRTPLSFDRNRFNERFLQPLLDGYEFA